MTPWTDLSTLLWNAVTSPLSSFIIWPVRPTTNVGKRDREGGDVTIYDTHSSRSRSRDMSGVMALMVLLAIVGTFALDAYAFSTFIGS